MTQVAIAVAGVIVGALAVYFGLQARGGGGGAQRAEAERLLSEAKQQLEGARANAETMRKEAAQAEKDGTAVAASLNGKKSTILSEARSVKTKAPGPTASTKTKPKRRFGRTQNPTSPTAPWTRPYTACADCSARRVPCGLRPA